MIWSKRDIVIFFAGAQVFHTITHFMLGISGILPARFFSILVTPQLNFFAIIINAVIALALIIWASRMHHR